MQTVRQHFRDQAFACRQLGSPFTAKLLELAATRLGPAGAVGRTVLTWSRDPRSDALALRFAGGLHALVLSGAAPALVRVYPGAHAEPDPDALWLSVTAALAAHEGFLVRFLASPPQTNEVARSAVLLGGFLTLRRRPAGRLPCSRSARAPG